MASCCFPFNKLFGGQDDERQPLLPQYNDDTSLQHRVHEKLHTYQMIRALGKGYMPSTEQMILNIRTLLAADVLNPTNPDLSESGRLLTKRVRQLLVQLIELLQNKNSADQIQDFIWFASKSRLSFDVEDIARRASKAKARADTAAAYRSLQTVGSLLLTNSDFRLFLSDLTVVARSVFKDTAFALSGVAEEVGKQLEPSEDEQHAIHDPDRTRPSGDDLGREVAEVSAPVSNGAAQVLTETQQSLADKLTGDDGAALRHRLKQAVLNLRKRRDYSDSVSTLSLLIRRYARLYSHAAKDTLDAAQDDVHENEEARRALRNFYALISSFGDQEQWKELERLLDKVMDHQEIDPEFDSLVNDIGGFLEKLLTDPDFLEHADQKFQDLREKSLRVGTDSSLRKDADDFLSQCQKTFQSVLDDKDVAGLIKVSMQVVEILSPVGNYVNGDLFMDAINVFGPLLIQAVQHVPIPRLEVSTPELDLLLENLIIEPGKTVNNTSFFPFRIRVETYNDLEIYKARFRTASRVSSLVTLKIDGLSMRAEEFGFWLRAHSGLLRLADQGIASFELDERGVDIHLDVEVGKDRLEKILTLKAVRVHIHKLSYKLRKSKFSFFGWLLRPLVRPIVRKVMERQLATAIADAIHAGNRELVYARERLRATRVADPQDMMTFIKAVTARLAPEDDPELYTRVGVEQPGKGVFRGVYAPGSVVKLWNEEAAQAAERVADNDQGGWRNAVFDVHTRMLT
ncbi:hypothetical protein EJ06DRAFT_333210 [Trichodelitschia bisporula]|uniref:HAM1-like N-terminal domain-containing protein n=1 Tax=Trichodelitschia bisporula TaxID=703511 RepID=A0A6G1I214_9PEZI|nr:hypothetical protein EJ06DRAFT_333210 [Trichodelitschia bisporula]